MLHQCRLLAFSEKYSTYFINLSDKALYLLQDQALSAREIKLLLSSLALCAICLKIIVQVLFGPLL